MVKSYTNQVHGGWLKAQAQAALPKIGREFDVNRDPDIAAQRRDLDKTEAQRREEQGGDGGRTQKPNVKPNDKPAPALKPPPHMRGSPGASNTDGQWLVVQHAQVMANIPKQAPAQNTPQQSVNQKHNQNLEPKRSIPEP